MLREVSHSRPALGIAKLYVVRMQLPDFVLERYFARHEFASPYLLCSSDIEGWKLADLLTLADEDGRKRWETLTLGYTEYTGLPALREEIARLYEGGIGPEHVLTFGGAQEALLVAFNVLLKRGDHAVVTWPGYQSLYELARAAGAEVTLLPLKEEDDWQLDLEALRRVLRPNTSLIAVNFPHNPTGSLPALPVFRELASLAAERGIRLLSDEVYRLLEYNLADRLPAAAELSPSALSLGVMSKAFGLAGLRVGWLVSRDTALLERLSAWKDYATICNSAPSEVLSLIALRAKAQVLERSHRLLRANLALADTFFIRHADRFRWVRPRAGSVAFPRLLREGSAQAFTERLNADQGVLLLPAEVYGFPHPHFRLGLGRSTFPAALERLEKSLSARVS